VLVVPLTSRSPTASKRPQESASENVRLDAVGARRGATGLQRLPRRADQVHLMVLEHRSLGSGVFSAPVGQIGQGESLPDDG